MAAREVPEPPDDGMAAGSDRDDDDATSADVGPKRKHFLPASIGLSVLLPPPGREGETLRATVHWADYQAEDHEPEDDAASKVKKKRFWRRVPHAPVTVPLPLDAARLVRGLELPDDPGIWLMGRLVAAEARGLEPGTRALSLFVVNRRGPGEKGKADERFLFQVRLGLECDHGFVARPNWRGEDADHHDEKIADLQFRHCAEWAVGHGVATMVGEETGTDGTIRRVATTWIPRAEVKRVVAHKITDLMIGMEALADAATTDSEALRRGPASSSSPSPSKIGDQRAHRPGERNAR